ncbi:MAG: sensory transduction histidine kinase [Gemmatimonadetes bacterium]|nr:sensory transduction histidine kinase [Gemmatimonadota bacterium]
MNSNALSELPPVHLGGCTMKERYHVCAFFDSTKQEDATMLPFLREGLEQGERGFCIVDPEGINEYEERLSGAGVPVAEHKASAQLEIRPWNDAYLREGHFDQDAMLSLIENVLKEGKAEGFPRTRLLAHMEWSCEDRPGVNDLVEYETRLNHILPQYPDPVVCAYDTSKYDGAVLMDILRTHPMVLVGGILRENPFFVPPDEFLRELRERSAERRPAS